VKEEGVVKRACEVFLSGAATQEEEEESEEGLAKLAQKKSFKVGGRSRDSRGVPLTSEAEDRAEREGEKQLSGVVDCSTESMERRG
jgi:hypothetical protein